jgi:hypothetical protein
MTAMRDLSGKGSRWKEIEASKNRGQSVSLVMGVNKDRGVIGAGKLADMVLVDGDPTKKTRDLYKISAVIKAKKCTTRQRSIKRSALHREHGRRLAHTAPAPATAKKSPSEKSVILVTGPFLSRESLQNTPKRMWKGGP